VHEITCILICHTKEITRKQRIILRPKHKNEELRNVDIFEYFPIEHATSGPEM
jgi:tRNA A22 N-methylase